MPRRPAVDVCIVGAGLAGLAAARALTERGADVVVVEARDRVGGRTLSQEMGRGRFDLGGQWLGPTQDRVAKLAAELGVETFPTHDEGRKVLVVRGRRSTYAGTIPRMAPHALLLLQAALSRIERLAARVSASEPWRSPRAGSLDAETVETWMRRTVPSAPARGVIQAAIRTIFGADPAEISMLYFLAYARGGGGLMRLVEIRGGAQERRFVRGSQELALALAERLGDRVHLATPARKVVDEGRRVTVHTDGGAFPASFAVVAVPPALTAGIAFDPSLPSARDALARRFPMGTTIKAHVLYERPFWREAGLSGEAVLTDGPVSVVFDNSSADLRQPALLAFSVGRPARVLGRLPEEERRRLVLLALARCFGPRATEPEAYIDKDWAADPWTRGCPTAIMSPGTLSVLGPALREPVGRIHWAGTETATEWPGYMEGALQSGERAAAELLARS